MQQSQQIRPEATDTALEYVGTDVTASFGDYRLNTGRIIRLFVRPDQFCALLCSLLTYSTWQKAAGDVISGMVVRPVVLDNGETFFDPCLNRSREISPTAVKGVIFEQFYLL